MRYLCLLLLSGLTFTAPVIAQTSCAPGALTDAAKQVLTTRHALHEVAVEENDAKIPSAVSGQLGDLKSALTAAADAAFSCASPGAAPEEIEKTLADALHANLSQASETVIVTRNKKDLGAYGSDLAVQIFPLYSSPRYYEVDFRYGMECGDDNLLLVFEAGHSVAAGNTAGWHEVLRWGAPTYSTVSDAYGDFVLLTPLSGFPGDRNWRFVVAHGEPACAAQSAPGHFDLDLLEPTANPAQPQIVWHLQHEYLRNEVPRLSTTEDTLTFQLSAPKEKTAKAPAHANTYRFRVSKDNSVAPLSGPSTDAPTPAPASTNSPQ